MTTEKFINTVTCDDNLKLLKKLDTESIDLCVIDPPYNVGYDLIDKSGNGFSDKWKDMDEYIDFMVLRIKEIHRVLKPTGSFYLHCDSHSSHYLKCEIDKIFGIKNFKNEIIWKRSTGHNDGKRYGNISDHILFYSKSKNYIWNKNYIPYSEKYLKNVYRHYDNKGQYRTVMLTAESLSGGGYKYIFCDHKRLWQYPENRMMELVKNDMIHYPKKKGGLPQKKLYLKDAKGIPLQNIWTDIKPLLRKSRVGYPSQKPIELLERIIKSSSNKGGIVLDCFMGSGTSMVVAKELGRRYIGVDFNKDAIKIGKQRGL